MASEIQSTVYLVLVLAVGYAVKVVCVIGNLPRTEARTTEHFCLQLLSLSEDEGIAIGTNVHTPVSGPAHRSEGARLARSVGVLS